MGAKRDKKRSSSPSAAAAVAATIKDVDVATPHEPPSMSVAFGSSFSFLNSAGFVDLFCALCPFQKDVPKKIESTSAKSCAMVPWP